MYLFRNARCFSQYRDLQVISLIAETSLREHGAGRRAPAPAVSTGGRAHVVAPYNRLSNCVPEYSRGTTFRRRSVLLTRVYSRQKGREADNKCSARAAPGRFRVTRDDRSSPSFRSSPGQIFDSLNSATIRFDTAKNVGTVLPLSLSRGVCYLFFNYSF